MTSLSTSAIRPFLPGGKDYALSKRFYAALGFEMIFDAGEVSGWYWSKAGEGVFLDGTSVCVACGPWQQEMHEPSGRHIARWDPARVVAECESKRRILERHEQDEEILRVLALPYADHRDYRDEWRI